MLRPRERYALVGPTALTDEALLGLVIGTGVATASGARSAERIAGDLLAAHGGLDGLARASVHSLARSPGCGPARAVRVHAALALARRLGLSDGPIDRVHRSADAWRLLRPHLEPLDVEELHALYLDRRGRVLAHQALTRGNDDVTVVDPRQVFRPAISLRARGVIVAHNHPSGDPTPSAMDHRVTERLVQAGRVLGINLLDHLVIGSGAYASLADEGLIPCASYTPPADRLVSGPR